MWKFLRGFAPAGGSRRSTRQPDPGPLASLARDYAALDATAWAIVRRRVHAAELEAK